MFFGGEACVDVPPAPRRSSFGNGEALGVRNGKRIESSPLKRMRVEAIDRDYDGDDAIPDAGRAFIGGHHLHRTAALAIDVAVDTRCIAVEPVSISLGQFRGRSADAVAAGEIARHDADRVAPVGEREAAVDDVQELERQRIGLLVEAVVPMRPVREEPCDGMARRGRAAGHAFRELCRGVRRREVPFHFGVRN